MNKASRQHPWSRVVIAFLISLLVTMIVGIVVHSQIILREISALGHEVDLGTRMSSTVSDLLVFAPVFGAISLALLPAFALSSFVSRGVNRGLRPVAYALSGWTAIYAAFRVIDAFAPMPVFLAGTRHWIDGLLVASAGAVGGISYSCLTKRFELRDITRPTITVVSAACSIWIVAILAASLTRPSVQSIAASSHSGLKVETLASGLPFPWSLAFLPDGRMLITERGGNLRMAASDGRVEESAVPIAPVSDFDVLGARLLDVAVDPEFMVNQSIYLSFSHALAGGDTASLVKGRLTQKGVEGAAVIFTADPGEQGASVSGGRIAFLEDRTLVFTLGDGFARREAAQDISNHRGKSVRLNRDGSVPADNPFVEKQDAALGLYTIGHRHPQGVAVDPRSGRLYSNEHGARGGDEINLMLPGRNYGWPITTHGIDYSFARITPFAELPGIESPLFQWTPSVAPSGMAIYAGAEFPDWEGDILVSTLRGRSIRKIEMSDGKPTGQQEVLVFDIGARIRDVRVGPGGGIYFLTDEEVGRLVRVSSAQR
ncbi:PQQ-dependent sugar dehydrogenase [Sinorhizobium sp. BG8]|uniref:PQQ-dependent sugar dehydrogenase n=1 Tax=Sinorhizobium sp. BG8 TaxID=2613773 RepID=UPI00193D8CAE|nr:PQQ-dependent sugar dehydrogenase [Sinorhizobium sp. BG8]QRM55080.1 PQQ-dependent sugar dehydrogenase [Sinorhizobium sp. BG8]